MSYPRTVASEEAGGVRRFGTELGLPGLIDVHTHFMPERVPHKVWDYFDTNGPLIGGLEWPITYRKEEAERMALLREFGVRAFTSMLYPHKPGMARWLNGWAADFARRTPDCLHTATLYPEPGVDTYVREALDAVHAAVETYGEEYPTLLEEAWSRVRRDRERQGRAGVGPAAVRPASRPR